jgi:c-di-GMP-binding flagellar brake protein YcgR
MSASPKNADTSGHLLRSSTQISRVLEALVARREVVTADLPGNQDHFTAHLISADPSGQFIIITTTADESANVALLARARVTLVSEPGNWHIEFVAVEPCEVMHDGTPAIRLRYPEILTVEQRRQNARHDVLPTVPLRCVADAGGITPFDAQIKDISVGGISVLHYPSDIMLEPGTVLVGSRIEIPGADPVTIDLEVRYSEVMLLPDGSRARCSGFRFVNACDDVRKLVDARAFEEKIAV